jgi:glutathione S-transferase
MIELYGHPFSSFTWKALIAAYARGVPFEFRMIGPDQPDNMARLAELSPTGQFPALTDGEVEITGSNAVIGYLDGIGDTPPLIPADRDAALRARMLADIFDDYVHVPLQRIVAECFRGDDEKDPRGVADARATLDKSYAWLARRTGQGWAVGDAFTLADCAAAPALFYADWVHPIPPGPLADYRARLLAHPPVARAVDEARPYRSFFPLGAPDRD